MAASRALGFVVACLVGVSLAARQSDSGQATFRTGVDLIQLDVSVLDDQRRPVTGLAAGDFTVSIDGVPRRVVAFSAVHVPAPAASVPAAAWTREIAPDVATNTRPGGRAIVIVIDDHTVTDPWWMVKARASANGVIDALGPDDVAAVVFSEYNHRPQGFTNDRRRLRSAIEHAPLVPRTERTLSTGAGPPSTPGQAGLCYCGVCTVEVLANITEALRSLPQQRKIVVYLSSGVAILPNITDYCNVLRRDAQFAALRNAALANVTIQAIDPQGLVADVLNDKIEYLRTMAESTGGRAVVNDNDMDQKVPAVLAESSSYYLLGVEPPGVAIDGRFHPIRVDVNRNGVEVRTRNGYYDPTAKERKAAAAAPPSRDLDAAISGVVAKRDIPMDVAVAPLSGDRRGLVAVVVGVTQPPTGLDERPLGREGVVDLVASLFAPETGRLISTRAERVALAWNATAAAPAYYEVLSRLAAPPGRYEVRVGVKAGDGRTASVYTYTEIPNFTGDALSLSGLILTSDPAPTSGGGTALTDVLPVVPTARRRFRPTDRVQAYLRVHRKAWSPETVAVTSRITDRAGSVVHERVVTIDGPDRGTNGADVRIGLPVADLGAGEYLLSVSVAAGSRTADRDLRFTIE